MSRSPKPPSLPDDLAREQFTAQRPGRVPSGSSICLRIIVYPLRLLGRSALAAANPAQDPRTGTNRDRGELAKTAALKIPRGTPQP
jgi:hypothetical protein